MCKHLNGDERGRITVFQRRYLLGLMMYTEAEVRAIDNPRTGMQAANLLIRQRYQAIQWYHETCRDCGQTVPTCITRSYHSRIRAAILDLLQVEAWNHHLARFPVAPPAPVVDARLVASTVLAQIRGVRTSNDNTGPELVYIQFDGLDVAVVRNAADIIRQASIHCSVNGKILRINQAGFQSNVALYNSIREALSRVGVASTVTVMET